MSDALDKLRENRREFDVVLELLDRMVEYINSKDDESGEHGFVISRKEVDLLWIYTMRLLSIQYPGTNLSSREIYQIVWGLDKEDENKNLEPNYTRSEVQELIIDFCKEYDLVGVVDATRQEELEQLVKLYTGEIEGDVEDA